VGDCCKDVALPHRSAISSFLAPLNKWPVHAQRLTYQGPPTSHAPSPKTPTHWQLCRPGFVIYAYNRPKTKTDYLYIICCVTVANEMLRELPPTLCVTTLLPPMPQPSIMIGPCLRPFPCFQPTLAWLRW
jgi:hypothetical protein